MSNMKYSLIRVQIQNKITNTVRNPLDSCTNDKVSDSIDLKVWAKVFLKSEDITYVLIRDAFRNVWVR